MANPIIATITNDGPGYVNSGSGTQMTTVNKRDLVRRENVWRSAIFRDINTPQPFATPARVMRGQVLKVQITCDRFDAATLRSVSVGFTPSEISY
jgi:hypothetical protein